MPSKTRRTGPKPSRRRLRCESDDEEELPPTKVAREPTIQPLTLEAKERNARQSLLDDLGSKRRDKITAADKAYQQSCNLSTIFIERDCNQPNTEAATLAVQNKEEIASWSNFGNTDVAKDGAYEVLPDIAMGQYHRAAVAERLYNEGNTHLEDSNGNRRGGGIPPAMATHDGSIFGRARPGRGSGGRPGPISSNAAYRPLDPAIIDGEKDSRYANGGLQSRSRYKSQANVRMENSTVKMSPVATRGGRAAASSRGGIRPVQHRPWPPAALEHLNPKLADPSDFMAAFANRQLQAKTPEPKKSDAIQPTEGKGASTVPLIPATTVKEVSDTLAEMTHIKQASREEFRAPAISPSSLTEGKPTPEVLQSPSVESEQDAAANTNLVGLGLSDIDVGAPTTRPSNVEPVPAVVEIEAAILQKFLLDKDVTGLIQFLEPLLKAERGDRRTWKPTQTTPTFAASKCASAVNDMANVAKSLRSPFRASEPVIADTEAHLKLPDPKSKPMPTSGLNTSQGLSESKWATGVSAPQTTPLLPKSTNNIVPKNDSPVIFGDLKNVSRVPKERSDNYLKDILTETISQKRTAIKRIRPGPGFQALVKEMESLKVKEIASLEVNAALKTANLLGVQYGNNRIEDDGYQTEESEL